MIHRLGAMIGSPHGSTGIPVETGRGTRCTGWVRAVPEPFYGGLLDRLNDAWAVIAGHAFAVRWPAAGELERALDGCTCHPKDNPPVPCAKKYALSKCRAEVCRVLDAQKIESYALGRRPE